MDNKKESFYFNYTLTSDDYENFNRLINKDKYKYIRRNKMVFGTVFSVFAIILLALLLLNADVYFFYIVLLLAMLGFGILNLVYFPAFFDKQMKKNSERTYYTEDNRLVGSNYKYDIREDTIEEKLSHSDGFLESHEKYNFSDIKRMYISYTGIILLFKADRGIYFPSRISSPEVDRDLKQFMIRKSQEYKVPVFYET